MRPTCPGARASGRRLIANSHPSDRHCVIWQFGIVMVCMENLLPSTIFTLEFVNASVLIIRRLEHHLPGSRGPTTGVVNFRSVNAYDLVRLLVSSRRQANWAVPCSVFASFWTSLLTLVGMYWGTRRDSGSLPLTQVNISPSQRILLDLVPRCEWQPQPDT